MSAIHHNPNPATTSADQKRVAFGEKIIKTLLQKNPVAFAKKRQDSPPLHDRPGANFNLDENCLDTPSCLAQNSDLQSYLNDIFSNFGSLLESRHVHVIPWSFEKFKNKTQDSKPSSDSDAMVAQKRQMPVPQLKNDEYLLHSFAKFSNNLWYHLDVIVSEDAAGKMTFRRFYLFEIPAHPNSLPEGVDC